MHGRHQAGGKNTDLRVSQCLKHFVIVSLSEPLPCHFVCGLWEQLFCGDSCSHSQGSFSCSFPPPFSSSFSSPFPLLAKSRGARYSKPAESLLPFCSPRQQSTAAPITGSLLSSAIGRSFSLQRPHNFDRLTCLTSVNVLSQWTCSPLCCALEGHCSFCLVGNKARCCG